MNLFSSWYGPGPSGATGPVGATGPQGIAGATGPVMPIWAGATTAVRTLNNTYQPNLTNAVFCVYTIEITCVATLLGGQNGSVELRSDSNSTPTTVRSTAANSNSVAIAIALTIMNSQRSVLAYLVPAGDYVRLVSSGNGASITIVNQTEILISN